MARLARQPSSEAEQADELRPLQPASTARRQSRRPAQAQAQAQAQGNTATLSPSPEASFSSDKENRSSAGRASRSSAQHKDKAATAGPSGLQTPKSIPTMTPRTNKRRRMDGQHDGEPRASQVAPRPSRGSTYEDLTKYYDPDQPIEERRVLRKGLRDLSRKLNGSQSDFLAPGHRGLLEAVHEANEIFSNVKQTSDATLDSRLLVSAADISYKKSAQLTLGDAAQGVDVDEFVSKCISFMRSGPASSTNHVTPSQRRRPRQTRRDRVAEADDDDDDDDDEGAGAADEEDALDWNFLGRRACFPTNSRPPVPGFLLGPLSLQKRARAKPSQRARTQRRDPADVVQAQELQAADIEKVENSNLVVLCTRIRSRLVQVQQEAQAAVEAEVGDDMSEDQVKALMSRHGIGDDGGVGFFNFVINPRSFGQTVENLFYVSFLIRDGSVGIGEDTDHLPTLHATKPRQLSEIKEQGVQKHQAVFNLDWHTWEELTKAFDITRPLIPHREDDDNLDPNAAGRKIGENRWYG